MTVCQSTVAATELLSTPSAEVMTAAIGRILNSCDTGTRTGKWGRYKSVVVSGGVRMYNISANQNGQYRNVPGFLNTTTVRVVPYGTPPDHRHGYRTLWAQVRAETGFQTQTALWPWQHVHLSNRLSGGYFPFSNSHYWPRHPPFATVSFIERHSFLRTARSFILTKSPSFPSNNFHPQRFMLFSNQHIPSWKTCPYHKSFLLHRSPFGNTHYILVFCNLLS